jgi:hypothetical protein
LTVRGKSHPWPFFTQDTPEKAEFFRGFRPPHPAAELFIHSLLIPAFDVSPGKEGTAQ